MIYCIISSQNAEQQHFIVMEPELKWAILCVTGKESEEEKTLQGFYKYFMVEVACRFACLSIIIWHVFMTAVKYVELVELCIGSVVII